MTEMPMVEENLTAKPTTTATTTSTTMANVTTTTRTITTETTPTPTTTTTTIITHKLDDSGGGGYNGENDQIYSTTPTATTTTEPAITIPIPLSRNYNTNGNASDSEEGFLSTSPDSANGELPTTDTKTTTQSLVKTAISTIDGQTAHPPPICLCMNAKKCVTLKTILDSFKSALSEEQAWALIYQTVSLYRNILNLNPMHKFNELEVPDTLENLSIHNDGIVHCSWSTEESKSKEEKIRTKQEKCNVKRKATTTTTTTTTEGEEQCDDSVLAISHKMILRKVAIIIYSALDYNLAEDEQCQMSQDLEELITIMTADENEDDCIDCSDCIDEGVQEVYKHFDDEHEDDKGCETKEFDFVLETCRKHVKPAKPEEHYKAVCRALVTETIELKIFLQHVLNDGADNLHMKADSQTSKQELAKLGFNDWARFWVQVIDELRRGVRLKKRNYERIPTEYELTPYEILMEDIRAKKYQLRKVMVNGDIPPRVKKDAHAMILEFIRSRPPLKKASERQLGPPLNRAPSPREQLMDSIRKGRPLKHITPPARLKDRFPVQLTARQKLDIEISISRPGPFIN